MATVGDQIRKNISRNISRGTGISRSSRSSSTSSYDMRKQAKNYQTRLKSIGIDPEEATDKRNWLEKALNLEQDQNFLFDIFEILGRPQNALFTGIANAQSGESFGQGLLEGIKGETKTSGKDLLLNAGMEEEDGKLDLTDVLGFGLDVFADPMDLALIPVTAGGSVAAKAGASGAIKGTKAVDTISDVSKAAKAIDTGADIIKGAKAVDTISDVSKAANALDAVSDASKAVKWISPSEGLFKLAGKGVKKVAGIADTGIEKILGHLDKKAKNLVDDLVAKGMSKADALAAIGKRVDKLDTYKALKSGISRTFDSAKNIGGFVGRSREIDNIADINREAGKIAIKELDDEVRALTKGDMKLYDEVAHHLNTLVEADYDWTIKGDEILDSLKPNKKIDMFSSKNADTLVNHLKSYGVDASVKDGRYITIKSKAGDKTLNLLKKDPSLRSTFEKLEFGKRLSSEDLEDIQKAKAFFKNNSEYAPLVDKTKSMLKKIAETSDELTGLNAANIAKEGYVPHVLTDDAKKELNKLGKSGNNQFNTRKYQMTTNEANRFKKAELEAKKGKIEKSIESKKSWFKTDKKGNIKFDKEGNVIRDESAYNEILSNKKRAIDNLKTKKESTEELLKMKKGQNVDMSKLTKKDREIVELAQKQEGLNESIKTLNNINYNNIDNVGAITNANEALTSYNRAQRKFQTALKNGVSGEKLDNLKAAMDTAAKEVRLSVQSLEKYANKQARDTVKKATKAFKEGKNIGTKIQKQTDLFYRNGETIKASYQAAADMTESLSKKIELAEADLLRYKDAKDAIFNQKFEEIGKLKDANNILSDPESFQFFNDNFMSNIGEYVDRNANFSRGAQVYNEALTRNLFNNTDYVKMAGDLKDGKVPYNFVRVDGNYLKNKLEKFNGILPEKSKALTDTLKKFTNSSVYLDKELASALKVLPLGNDIHPLLKVWDGVNNTFKKFSTLSLGFQTRNILGNSTNMVLSGMPASQLPTYYKKAANLWNKSDDLVKKFATKGIDSFTAAEKADWDILLQFKKAGFGEAFTKGQGLEDIAKAEKGIINKASKKSIELNNKLDNYNRLALLMYANDNPKYVQKLGKANAIDAVKYTLFDPSNMSSFEKNAMKRAIPFYTFTKQNLLFQADNIMRNTPRYNRLFKGLNSLYRSVGNESYYGYQKNAMQIPIPFTDENGNTLFIKANLPLSDLGEFMSSPIQRVVSSTSPIIKAPFEMVTGVDTFTGQKANNTTLSGVLNKMGVQSTPSGIKTSLDAAETILKSMGLTNLTTNTVKKVSKILDISKGEDISGMEIWAEIFRSVLQNTNQEKIENSRVYENLQDYQAYVKQLKNQGIEVPTIRDLDNQSRRSLRKIKTRRNSTR